MASTAGSTGWLRGKVKAVPSGDSLVIMGSTKAEIPPEKTITLSSLIAPRLARRGGVDEHAAKNPKPAGKPAQEMRKDRKSGTGMSGSPKKGGHGGKFTWSGDGYSHAELGRIEMEAVDANDPNFYDPDEQV